MFTTIEKSSSRIKAEDFLKVQDDFHLGFLPTEQSHPETRHLSDLAKNDLVSAISILKKIDVAALNILYNKIDELTELSKEIINTLNSGGRIFIFGCGATGRLALTLELLWRATNKDQKLNEAVIASMSGGDAALIRSIEDFEDHPEFGAKQLKELGFREGDLLISSTEGGETPIVIGATEHALTLSSRKPYFLYCNPDKPLCEKVERSRRVIQNEAINKINLTTGPMAVSGSTRMQASTVLLAGIGAALFATKNDYDIKNELDQMIGLVSSTDFSLLAPIIVKESELYSAHKGIIYKTASEYAMTVLTDTTERSPTFSLPPFENYLDANPTPSQVYLSIPGAKNTKDAWHVLLKRDPRALDWKDYKDRTSLERLYGFNISEEAPQLRARKFSELNDAVFLIDGPSDQLRFGYQDQNFTLSVKHQSLFAKNLLLKLLLNTHSTLVMGKLGRFEGNSMTWVKMANNKLIDRAARYTIQILYKDGYKQFSYEDVIYELFKQEADLAPGEAVVIKTVAAFKNKN